jgi:ABC-type transport system involved in cytochrome c biogenesis permease subunit
MLSGISTICFGACYAVAIGLEILELRSLAAWRRAALIGVTAAGLLAQTLYLAYRGMQAGTIPDSTAAEWLQLASWALAIVYFAALFYLARTPTGLVLLPIVLALVVGSHWASTEPLAPEGTSYVWGMFHGSALLLGTVTVCIGFLAGLMYLVQSYALKHARSAANGLRLPSLEWLEHVNSRSLGLSAVLIALGFLSGLAMSVAEHRDQAAYVLWADPLVLSLGAMLMWLIAAEVFRLVYPAARRGRKVAYLTLASFLFLIIALASLTLLDSVHGAESPKTLDVHSKEPQTGEVRLSRFQSSLADLRAGSPPTTGGLRYEPTHTNPKSEIRNPKSTPPGPWAFHS